MQITQTDKDAHPKKIKNNIVGWVEPQRNPTPSVMQITIPKTQHHWSKVGFRSSTQPTLNAKS
ncbi:hypothetical protein [Scytonema sp. NUACC21]